MKQPVTSRWRGIGLGLIIVLAVLLVACSNEETIPAEAPAKEEAAVAQDSAPKTADNEQTTAADSESAPVSDSGPATDLPGYQIFMDNCAKCHGPEGLGNGPSVGSLRTQAGMNLAILQERSDEELLTTISTGKGSDMPPWALVLSLEEREQVLEYVRTLGN